MYIHHLRVDEHGTQVTIQATRDESVPCFIQSVGTLEGYTMREPEITRVITKTFPTNTVAMRYDQDPTYLAPRPRRGYFYTVTGAIPHASLYINVTVEQYDGPRLRVMLYVATHRVIGRGRVVPLFESYPIQQITQALMLAAQRLSTYLNCAVELKYALAQVLDENMNKAAGYPYDATSIFQMVRRY